MDLRKELSARILELPDVKERKSKFAAAPAFFRGKKEFAHFHGPREIDLRVTKAKIRSLGLLKCEDARIAIENRSGDWIQFRFEGPEDLDECLRYAEIAHSANK